MSFVAFPDSSSLAGIAYDQAAQILVVAFRDASAHCYAQVPATLVAQLCQASSKGAFFNSRIRRHFAAVKLLI